MCRNQRDLLTRRVRGPFCRWELKLPLDGAIAAADDDDDATDDDDAADDADGLEGGERPPRPDGDDARSGGRRGTRRRRHETTAFHEVTRGARLCVCAMSCQSHLFVGVPCGRCRCRPLVRRDDASRVPPLDKTRRISSLGIGFFPACTSKTPKVPVNTMPAHLFLLPTAPRGRGRARDCRGAPAAHAARRRRRRRERR